MNLPLSIGAKKITSVATVLSNIHSVLGLLKKQTPLKGAFDTISFNKSKQWLLYLNSDLVEYPSAKPTENVERLFIEPFIACLLVWFLYFLKFHPIYIKSDIIL